MCPECRNEVIPRQGNIRKHHFAHKMSDNPCSYFDRPTESQQHAIGKRLIASLLQDGKEMEISYRCIYNSTPHIIYEKFKMIEGDTIVLEYRDPKGTYVADLAILNNGFPRVIIEICHTHKTTTNVRPEPWFELSTEHIFGTDLSKDVFHVECSRSRTSLGSACVYCRLDIKMGAIDTSTGAFVLPDIAFKNSEFECISCKQPVSFSGFIFNHVSHTTCKMYTYPSIDQQRKNIIYILGRLLQEHKLKLSYGCTSTFFSGQCSNRVNEPIEYAESDSVEMNLDKYYVRLLRTTTEIKHEFRIVADYPPEDEPLRDKNAWHVTLDDIWIGNEPWISLHKNGFCDTCKLLDDNKQYLERIPKVISYRDEHHKKCILCDDASNSFGGYLYFNNYLRALCTDCMESIDSNLDKLKAYAPKCEMVDGT